MISSTTTLGACLAVGPNASIISSANYRSGFLCASLHTQNTPHTNLWLVSAG